MSEEFRFEYTKYISGGLSVEMIDNLLFKLTNFTIPKIPIPLIGAYVELAMFAMQIAGIVSLLVMRKERVDLELLVAKQLHQQSVSAGHDDEVIN